MGGPVVVCQWLVRPGARVSEGEALVELLAGPAVVDVTSPVDGVLSRARVGEEAVVAAGDVLATIRTDT